MACYEEGVAPLTRGCSPQSWDANSSESCAWKFRVIWSSVLPMGGPRGLNTQAHSGQPPITLSSLIRTVLRDELSWPGVGTQHLTSGQRKVRHATLPHRMKAGPASIHNFYKGTGRYQGSVKVNCCKRGVIGCFMSKTLMQSVISELQKERKRLEDDLHRVAAALTAFGNFYMHGGRPTRKTRTISAAGRKRIAAAQRARWAKIKGQKGCFDQFPQGNVPRCPQKDCRSPESALGKVASTKEGLDAPSITPRTPMLVKRRCFRQRHIVSKSPDHTAWNLVPPRCP